MSQDFSLQADQSTMNVFASLCVRKGVVAYQATLL